MQLPKIDPFTAFAYPVTFTILSHQLVNQHTPPVHSERLSRQTDRLNMKTKQPNECITVSSQLKSKVKGPPKDAAGVFVGINPRTIMGTYKRVDPFGGPISSLFYSCAFKDEKV